MLLLLLLFVYLGQAQQVWTSQRCTQDTNKKQKELIIHCHQTGNKHTHCPPDRRPGCGKKQRRLRVWTDGPLIHPVVRDYFIVFINAPKYANFILWHHMPRQVLCKASSRRSGLRDAIGGAGTLPSGPLTPILQLTFHSLGQHVTGALRGETHSHVTYFAAQRNNSCFTKSHLVENPPITPWHLTPASAPVHNDCYIITYLRFCKLPPQVTSVLKACKPCV